MNGSTAGRRVGACGLLVALVALPFGSPVDATLSATAVGAAQTIETTSAMAYFSATGCTLGNICNAGFSSSTPDKLLVLNNNGTGVLTGAAVTVAGQNASRILTLRGCTVTWTSATGTCSGTTFGPWAITGVGALTISGLTLAAAGTLSIKANQTGTGNPRAATMSMTVTKANLTPVPPQTSSS